MADHEWICFSHRVQPEASGGTKKLNWIITKIDTSVSAQQDVINFVDSEYQRLILFSGWKFLL